MTNAYFNFVNEGGEGFCAADMINEEQAYAAAVARDNADFASIWTADVTARRRAAWNAEVKSHAGKIDLQTVQAKMGFNLCDLQRAVKIYA